MEEHDRIARLEAKVEQLEQLVRDLLARPPTPLPQTSPPPYAPQPYAPQPWVSEPPYPFTATFSCPHCGEGTGCNCVVWYNDDSS